MSEVSRTTLADGLGNVFVVLAGKDPMIFTEEDQAQEYADLSGNGPVLTIALRTREDAEDLLVEWRDDQG